MTAARFDVAASRLPPGLSCRLRRLNIRASAARRPIDAEQLFGQSAASERIARSLVSCTINRVARIGARLMSACPPTAAQKRTFNHFGLVPQPDSCSAAKKQRYSITSSARASSMGGGISPSAWAVFRLMTVSNLVGCSTGRSAGFSPLNIRSTKYAARRQFSRKSMP